MESEAYVQWEGKGPWVKQRNACTWKRVREVYGDIIVPVQERFRGRRVLAWRGTQAGVLKERTFVVHFVEHSVCELMLAAQKGFTATGRKL